MAKAEVFPKSKNVARFRAKAHKEYIIGVETDKIEVEPRGILWHCVLHEDPGTKRKTKQQAAWPQLETPPLANLSLSLRQLKGKGNLTIEEEGIACIGRCKVNSTTNIRGVIYKGKISQLEDNTVVPLVLFSVLLCSASLFSFHCFSFWSSPLKVTIHLACSQHDAVHHIFFLLGFGFDGYPTRFLHHD
jgi:hypothetical protein